MSAFDQLKWAVAHDPCRAGDRTPQGAVGLGASVEVLLRVDATVRGLVRSASALVCEREEWNAEPGWRSVALASCDAGFAGGFSLRDDPHVAFYLFELDVEGAEEDEQLYYVPCADGRSTAGELVRGGVDGELTQGGWKHALSRWATYPQGELGLPEMPGGFQVTVFDDTFKAPGWSEGVVMYQIFPDRFARGGRGVRAEGLAYHERMGRPVRLHESWAEPVEWKAPDETMPGPAASASESAAHASSPPVAPLDSDTAVPCDDSGENAVVSAEAREAREALEAQMTAYDPIDFFGGTLDGIREKLGYLASLGVELVYLNPVFEARSNHRYDTADYERIDPLLGDEAAFERLAREACAHGISLVLDAVLSHTGDDSRYFNATGAYGSVGAMQDAGSPFRAWYDFANPSEGAAYRCWWGYPSLPEVDEQNESWQAYMLGRWWEGALDPGARARLGALDEDALVDEVGVLGKWLHVGAAGFRLDVADEIPDAVLERIRASVKRANPEALVIGEVWEDATSKTSYGASRTYALGRSLDSVMNYPLRSALVGFALGTVDAHQLGTFLKLQRANYPAAMHARLMNLLSTHDVERIRTVLALGGPLKHLSRDGQLAAMQAITSAQDALGAQLQRMIVSLLYSLPGMPCLYYGDERGLQGGGDPFCRAAFPWGGEGDAGEPARVDCGEDLTAFYQQLGQLRKSSQVLKRGAFACVAPDSDVLCVLRYDPASQVAFVAAANRSDIPRRVAIDLFAPALSLPPGARSALRSALLVGSPQFHSEGDLHAIEHVSCEGGIVRLTVPPRSTTYWKTE